MTTFPEILISVQTWTDFFFCFVNSCFRDKTMVLYPLLFPCPPKTHKLQSFTVSSRDSYHWFSFFCSLLCSHAAALPNLSGSYRRMLQWEGTQGQIRLFGESHFSLFHSFPSVCSCLCCNILAVVMVVHPHLKSCLCLVSLHFTCLLRLV